MSKIQFDVNVANGVAINVANDILRVWWMEVYPFRVNQSESLLHAEIKGAAVAEWLSSWLAEQEDMGSIPGLATWIFRDWLSPASKSRYG